MGFKIKDFKTITRNAKKETSQLVVCEVCNGEGTVSTSDRGQDWKERCRLCRGEGLLVIRTETITTFLATDRTQEKKR